MTIKDKVKRADDLRAYRTLYQAHKQNPFNVNTTHQYNKLHNFIMTEYGPDEILQANAECDRLMNQA